jgi:outer membrane receptor for ferrienterochelin and colicin
MFVIAGRAIAQDVSGPVITGRVTDASSKQPLPGVTVTLEGTRSATITDSAGDFRLARIRPGQQVLRAQRIGYAPSRIDIVVPTHGSLTHNIVMARHALELKGIEVTADPTSRARGELGTASVIEQEAIKNQSAASLAGVLELLPGVPLQAPGLDNVQQIPLRSVPISSGDPNSTNRSAEDLAAFGTLIILDGVPLSNNANLQSLGSRSDLSFSTSAGGGIDLRRIPATTLERVEVIRGVPSAKYGDLTQGAIIVDTRAGVVDPAVTLRFDARTTETSIVGGMKMGRQQTGTITTDYARTRLPGAGTRSDETTRLSAQLAHRAVFGVTDEAAITSNDLASRARLIFDTRAEAYRLLDNRPEQETLPGTESRSRDVGARISERIRLRMGYESHLEITSAFERTQQQSFARNNQLRGATPVTNLTTPGQAIGRYLGGLYNARVDVDGDPMLIYTRAEVSTSREALGISHDLRFGTELRRESNNGKGYQFDIEFPSGSTFNGVRGFDRPRSFSAVPPVPTSAFYIDDKMSRALPSGMLLNVQAGLRADVMHRGTTWFSGARDAVLQPRLNVELAPKPWLSIRGGVGTLAKSPALADLFPAPEYFDVINVNFFANDPAERLAVLTTSVFDPTNPDLKYSISKKAEAGIEMRLGSSGATLGLVGFNDKIEKGVGDRPEATFILREHFALTNTVPGTGKPPVLVLPPISADSVPILIDRPANNVTESSKGFELTATLPEIPSLKTRLSFQSALVKSTLQKDGIEFARTFPDFQISENQKRSPYYNGIERTGERWLLTTRIIHHQPAVGLVLTGTIQHTLRNILDNIGGTDTLAFAGYITRGGSLVPVAPADRGRPEYADVRIPRRGILSEPQRSAPDWIFSFQVAKTLPLDGRLSFYAFNAFDRIGHFGGLATAPNFYASTRFGLEITMPLEALFAWR